MAHRSDGFLEFWASAGHCVVQERPGLALRTGKLGFELLLGVFELVGFVREEDDVPAVLAQDLGEAVAIPEG